MAVKDQGTIEKDIDPSLNFSRKRFDLALKRHGYGFHYAVLNEIQRIFVAHGYIGSTWGVAANEFPVAVQGKSTRIDFILRNFINEQKRYMVSECKRVNPAFAHWCFLKKPSYGLDPEKNEVVGEEIFRRDNDNRPVQSQTRTLFNDTNIYHLALEVKTGKKGDPSGRSYDSIEQAATQVCRGLNGLINYFRRNPNILGKRQPIALATKYNILPTIFTTASIFCSDLDLSKAELETGDIDITSELFEEKPWIFYQYHQSPELMHEAVRLEKGEDLQKSLYQEYVRTIAVVNASGVEDFLSSDMWRIG